MLAEKRNAEARDKRSGRLFSGVSARKHRRQDEQASELPPPLIVQGDPLARVGWEALRVEPKSLRLVSSFTITDR